MDSVESQLRQMKEFTRSMLLDHFKVIESEIGEDLPEDFMNMVISTFENRYPHNARELKRLKHSVFFGFTDFSQYTLGHSETVDQDCKNFVKKIIDELYVLDPKVGIGNNLWKYFVKIWQFNQIVTDVISMDDDTIKTVTKLYQLQSFYQTLSELTWKFLIEFTYKIALKNRQCDADSIKFIMLYDKKRKEGQSPLKRELLEYCIKTNLIQKGKCSFLKNSSIRNSIAHANVSYNEKTNKIVFGKHEMTVIEFKMHFQEILGINTYILNYYFEKTHFFENLSRQMLLNSE